MSEITPAEKVAATPPTVELVADLLAEADNDYHDGHSWKLRMSAKGSVVSIGIEALADDGGAGDFDEATLLPEVHFRAVVVETPAFVAADGPVDLPAHTARELACEDAGYAVDGWTVVANEYVESGRWESLHELVIRNEAGQHFMDTYRRGLTEHQDSGPYEYETKAMFTAVVPKFKVVAEWVSAEAAQAEQNGGAS